MKTQRKKIVIVLSLITMISVLTLISSVSANQSEEQKMVDEYTQAYQNIVENETNDLDTDMSPLASINGEMIYDVDVEYERTLQQFSGNTDLTQDELITIIARWRVVVQLYDEQLHLIPTEEEIAGYYASYEDSADQELVDGLVYQQTYLEKRYRFKAWLIESLMDDASQIDNGKIMQMVEKIKSSELEINKLTDVINETVNIYIDDLMSEQEFIIY